MYLLQERQLKTKRPGRLLLPAARRSQTLDRLTYPHARARLSVPHDGADPRRAVGADGVGQRVHRSIRSRSFSFVAWVIYAGTLAGRAAARLARPARRLLRRSSASRCSSSRWAPGSSCPGGTAPDGALRRRPQPPERAGRAARAARRRGGQAARAARATSRPAASLREVVVLSTCNRVEVYGVAEVPGEARAAVFRHLCRQRGVDLARGRGARSTRTWTRTPSATPSAWPSSLDSMMIGEPQILGQVKDAFALAQACETVGPDAAHALHAGVRGGQEGAHRDGDRAPRGLGLVRGGRAGQEDLRRARPGRAVLLVGAGKMSELAAKHLVEQGAFPIYVDQPDVGARAGAGARAGRHRGALRRAATSRSARVDIVVTSTGATEPVIRRDLVQRVMHGRRGRPLFFIDIAVPRDVEPRRRTRSTTCTATTSTTSSRSSTRTSASARARRSAPRRSSSARSAKFVGPPARRRGDPDHRVAARAARGASAPAEVRRTLARAARRLAGDAGGHRGAVERHRQQDPARADHQAARVVAGGRRALVDRAGARAVRAGADARDPARARARARWPWSQARERRRPRCARAADEVEIVPMRTEGDRLAEARLAAVGGKGLFVREIEEALLRAARSTSPCTASRTCPPSCRRARAGRASRRARTRATCW